MPPHALEDCGGMFDGYSGALRFQLTRAFVVKTMSYTSAKAQKGPVLRVLRRKVGNLGQELVDLFGRPCR